MKRPWWNEENKVDFAESGLACALRRGPLGAWCGYVGVSAEHPWFGKSYSEEVSVALSISLCCRVHGGLTWAADCMPSEAPDGRWWFGFDCAHAGDLVPSCAENWSAQERKLFARDVYRDQQFVVSETQSLAAQLARVGGDCDE